MSVLKMGKVIRKNAIFQKKLYFFGYFLLQTLDRVALLCYNNTRRELGLYILAIPNIEIF